ncbi:MAG TPA: HAMP domain-containing sensor histidine kinase [Actinomycetota bacterium]|jgi:signal transduction histidine kinase|nr:HAMP domain-containing sensor histidine kinase [Actinomycetota bacterium]
MTVRSRLVIAFAYVSIITIAALMIPLALTLDRRARAEFERENVIRATTIAQDVGAENLRPGSASTLRGIVRDAASQVAGRVIVVDHTGALVADSLGPATGQPYATSGRPEIGAALADAPTSVIRFSQDLGTDIMATAVPIVDERPGAQPTVVGAVRITQSMAAVNENVRRVTFGVLAIGAGGLLAGLVLAVAMSSSLSRPLRRLADAAQRFGSPDLSVRVGAVNGPTEVTQLATSFDAMADRVQQSAEAQEAFVANASHQLRTPLTGMKLRLEGAIADERDDAVRAELVAAEAEVDRLSVLVTRLLAMAAGDQHGAAERCDLSVLARDAVERRRADDVRVAGEPAEAMVHANDVAQLIDTVLDNAAAYAPGPVEVSTGTRNGHAWIAVRDHGLGMPGDVRARATERFYRAPGAPAGGSGLGLAIVRELAEGDGGTLTIDTADGGGTLVEVRYPSALAKA